MTDNTHTDDTDDVQTDEDGQHPQQGQQPDPDADADHGRISLWKDYTAGMVGIQTERKRTLLTPHDTRVVAGELDQQDAGDELLAELRQYADDMDQIESDLPVAETDLPGTHTTIRRTAWTASTTDDGHVSLAALPGGRQVYSPDQARAAAHILSVKDPGSLIPDQLEAAADQVEHSHADDPEDGNPVGK